MGYTLAIDTVNREVLLFAKLVLSESFLKLQLLVKTISLGLDQRIMTPIILTGFLSVQQSSSVINSHILCFLREFELNIAV